MKNVQAGTIKALGEHRSKFSRDPKLFCGPDFNVVIF